jgi:hypothetical protein
MANDHGLGRRALSSRKPGSSVASVPATVGAPVPTRYTPAKSASEKDTYSWPAATVTPRASPSHVPALVVSAVSVAGEPHTNDLSPEPVVQPAPTAVVMNWRPPSDDVADTMAPVDAGKNVACDTPSGPTRTSERRAAARATVAVAS